MSGRHEDQDGDGVADYAQRHPYRAATDATHTARALTATAGLTAATLRTAMGASLGLERYAALLPAFTAMLEQTGATTVNRAAMLAAQIGHESVGLKYPREIWGPSAQQLKYDPASGSQLSKTLGNTQRGDGFAYRGAGWLQVTGRGNFAAVSKWAHGKGYVPTASYFVDHPDELGSDRYVWIGPTWYWLVARAKLNSYADAGDILAATKAINGGTTGLADRTARWNTCLKLGAALLPATTQAPRNPRFPGTEYLMEPITVAPWTDASGKVHNTGRVKRTLPVGSKSACISAAWLNLQAGGPADAKLSATIYPLGDTGGSGSIWQGSSQNDSADRGQRTVYSVPDATTCVLIDWSVTGSAGAYGLITPELAPK